MKYQSENLSKFPEQIKYALKNYQTHVFKAGNFDNIILGGLGGSGIAGHIVKSFFQDTCPLPVEVVSNYCLPKYAGKKTLAILSSYSGNTEETLAMYKLAKERGCTIIVMTTGGKLGDLAAADGRTIYKAEKGYQPRMALGYSLTYLLLFFGELIGQDLRKSLEKAAEELSDTQKYIDEGEKLFSSFKNRLPNKLVVVADYLTSPIALRFCQQVQENAKAEAFFHELPEANHNVIESYYGQLNSVFIFLNSHINERTDLRFQFLNDLLNKNSNLVITQDVEALSISSILKNIYILDWTSLWMADAKEVNSADIQNINALKEFLEKQK